MVVKNKLGYNNYEMKYYCDRKKCGKEMQQKDKYTIYIENYNYITKGLYRKNAKRKMWDLCPRCYKMLKRGIEKTE